jgi:hypothetical protein
LNKRNKKEGEVDEDDCEHDYYDDVEADDDDDNYDILMRHTQ